MPVRAHFLAVLLCLAASASQAQATAWQLDPVHTRVAFRVDHAGFSHALGTFAGITGNLVFDPDDWRGAQIDVRIPLPSLDLGDADWNEKVLGRSFLDAKGQPEARFTSSRIEPTGEGRANVTGQLQLRGVSREVILQVQLNALKRHPITRRSTVGFSATGTLSRRDFGIDSWPNVIGDEVSLVIEVEATRGKSSDPPTIPENTDADQE